MSPRADAFVCSIASRARRAASGSASRVRRAPRAWSTLTEMAWDTTSWSSRAMRERSSATALAWPSPPARPGVRHSRPWSTASRSRRRRRREPGRPRCSDEAERESARVTQVGRGDAGLAPDPLDDGPPGRQAAPSQASMPRACRPTEYRDRMNEMTSVIESLSNPGCLRSPAGSVPPSPDTRGTRRERAATQRERGASSPVPRRWPPAARPGPRRLELERGDARGSVTAGARRRRTAASTRRTSMGSR